MELKGSKTEKNLMEAFAGESQARNKYTYFASKAKKDGYDDLLKIQQAAYDRYLATDSSYGTKTCPLHRGRV